MFTLVVRGVCTPLASGRDCHLPCHVVVTPPVQAVAARLEALENDAAAPDAAGGDTDDEFVLPADSDAEETMQFGPASGKRRKGQKGGGGMKRKTRGMAAERTGSRGNARTFAALLEDVSWHDDSLAQ
jgi:hypothetical protein